MDIGFNSILISMDKLGLKMFFEIGLFILTKVGLGANSIGHLSKIFYCISSHLKEVFQAFYHLYSLELVISFYLK